MRALVQRVSQASVSVEGKVVGAIGRGMLVLLGVALGDSDADIDWMARKLVQLRIFPDEAGLMNKSLLDAGCEMLVISQFTLHGSYKKGNRPSFILAERPEKAAPLYEAFAARCEELLNKPVARGVFGADMQVSLTNDGPVTLMLDSQRPE